MIVLNSLTDDGAGFKVDTNKITILTDKGETIAYPLKSKKEVAEDIVKTYPVSAAKAVKMNIVPTVEGGSIGIVIEIDDSTNDVPVDIVIPGEWI